MYSCITKYVFVKRNEINFKKKSIFLRCLIAESTIDGMWKNTVTFCMSYVTNVNSVFTNFVLTAIFIR